MSQNISDKPTVRENTMKTEHKEEYYIRKDKLSDLLTDEKSLFFNIETTGFSPAHTQVYLIGCASRIGSKLILDQFFADSRDEEPEILHAFMDILKNFSTLISFNGVGFDIPFLKAKCDSYKIAENFSDLNYLDIFKSVSELKPLLNLPNYKQTTIEKFLDIHREDPFSGGELINVYYDYRDNPSDEAYRTLLLHNYEDILGMADMMPILSYLEIFHGQYSITETLIEKRPDHEGDFSPELTIRMENDYFVPKRVSVHRKGFYFRTKESSSLIRVPIYTGELHFFYPDCKNYSRHNQKTGEFLPQYTEIMNPVYRKDDKDKVSYFELTKDFCSSDIMLRRYADHILKLLLEKH